MIGSAVEQNKARRSHPVVHGNCLPMWIYDRRTLRFLEVSEGATRLYGYTREEFLKMTIREIGPVEELTKLAHLDPGAVNGNHRWAHRRKDGTPLMLAIHSNALIYEGRLARLVVATEVGGGAEKPNGTAVREPLGEIDPPEMPAEREFVPKPWLRMAEETTAARAERRDARSFQRPVQRAEAWADPLPERRNGAERAAESAGRMGARIDGPAALHDSSALPEGKGGAAGEERRHTVGDGALLERRAEEAFDHASRARRRVAVVCLDLDNLEEVLERCGAEGADLCVESIGVALTRRLRGMDTVARTGTKSFTIILAELDDDFALHRVAGALLKIFAAPIQVQGQPFVISASIGVAVYPDDGFDLARLTRAADTAMHQARASGGHRVAMFSLEVRERTELDTYMREAMKRGGFRLYYQPQYSPNGEIRTLEALLRLPGKDAGFISPDLFIPIAEDSGMIEQLGMWVIEQASRQVKAWHREYGRLAHVAVNVSPLQLRGPEFAERALSTIRSHGVVPASIEFEITERAVLNFDEVAEPMRKLSEAGIIFAVDDFGTGYSSLQHLHRLPISVLKIDRSFVQRVGVPEGSEAIIEAIVSMAHSLGMRVVAEGVETQAQRSAATQMGCDSIQGFLHTPAVDAAQIPELMGWLN